jgi:hypothetical protein
LKPEFDVICAALETFEQYLMANTVDGAEDLVIQFTENAFEMLRQAQAVVSGVCPVCEGECLAQSHSEESETIDVLNAQFELDTDEGQLRLNLHQEDGSLMEVTEWVRCTPKEENGMVYYDFSIATSKVLRLLAAQLDRKRKMAKQ